MSERLQRRITHSLQHTPQQGIVVAVREEEIVAFVDLGNKFLEEKGEYADQSDYWLVSFQLRSVFAIEECPWPLITVQSGVHNLLRLHSLMRNFAADSGLMQSDDAV